MTAITTDDTRRTIGEEDSVSAEGPIPSRNRRRYGFPVLLLGVTIVALGLLLPFVFPPFVFAFHGVLMAGLGATSIVLSLWIRMVEGATSDAFIKVDRNGIQLHRDLPSVAWASIKEIGRAGDILFIEMKDGGFVKVGLDQFPTSKQIVAAVSRLAAESHIKFSDSG